MPVKQNGDTYPQPYLDIQSLFFIKINKVEQINNCWGFDISDWTTQAWAVQLCSCLSVPFDPMYKRSMIPLHGTPFQRMDAHPSLWVRRHGILYAFISPLPIKTDEMFNQTCSQHYCMNLLWFTTCITSN